MTKDAKAETQSLEELDGLAAGKNLDSNPGPRCEYELLPIIS